MAVRLNRGRSPVPGYPFRRLVTRAEAAILLGMLACISSLFVAWPLSMSAKLAIPAIVVDLTRSGAAIDSVRWPILAGAILSGLLLAVTHASSSRIPVIFVQALCGIVCLVIGLMHFAMLPGPLLDLLGGALLSVGAVDRLTQDRDASH